tara:strand:+ start:43 stop:1290 length:1248 start_codon:yes stop_codon:yes gene_type:complete
MTIVTAAPGGPNPPLSFTAIEEEFGPNPGRSLGQYRTEHPSRVSPSNPSGLFDNSSPQVGLQGSSLSNLPLDEHIPTNGEIKFSDFLGKKLNIVIDYYTGGTAIKRDLGKFPMSAKWIYSYRPNRVKIVGGFRGRPDISQNWDEWDDGKRVIIHVNKEIGGVADNNVPDHDVSLRTGYWPQYTDLRVDVGPSGKIFGAGGHGGSTSNNIEHENPPNADPSYNGTPAGSGTSALGIDYGTAANKTIINNQGIIRCGYGGGGCGSSVGNDPSDSSDTDYGRSGGGGGGGSGLPAGAGGAAGRGGFNGVEPINGYAGSAGNTPAAGGQGGNGGAAGNYGGAQAGRGGNGGDFNDPAESGADGSRADDRAYTDTPTNSGLPGADGSAIRFGSSSIQSSTIITGNSIGGRNGGTSVGYFQ